MDAKENKDGVYSFNELIQKVKINRRWRYCIYRS